MFVCIRLGKSGLLCGTSNILLRGDEEKQAVSVQWHSGVSTDKRERERDRDVPLSPRLHCYPTDNPAGGQKSVQPDLSCTEVSSLLVCPGIMGYSLLLAARGFSRDPERVLPQRLTNFITTFSQLCSANQTEWPTRSQSSPTSVASPNLISHPRHNRKIRPVWAGIF